MNELISGQLSSQRILVTGGCGLIGTNLVHCLKRKCDNASITVLDNASTGDKSNLSELDVRIVTGSIIDQELVSDLVRTSDVLFHLAARNILVSSDNPREDFQVNIAGTLNLLLESSRFGVKRFIYASTSSVYGNARYLPIHEDDAKTFLNFYSVSKFSGESYCNAFYELHRLPTTIVRYSNVYGEYQSPYSGVVAKFIARAIKNEEIPIHGDGEQTRDFTYVQDAVEATALCAAAPQAIGKTYNVSTGRETSINSLLQLILGLCNSSAAVRNIDRRDIDNIRRRVLNIEAIRHDLGWIPRVTLEEGLQRTIHHVQRSNGCGSESPSRTGNDC